MKNYSTVSLGQNDTIRQIYERSASNQSFNSCTTPRRYSNIEDCLGGFKSNRLTVSNSLAASPVRIEKQTMSSVLKHEITAQSSLANIKIGHEEAKVVWPSKKPKT